jgi:hypothetical protein
MGTLRRTITALTTVGLVGSLLGCDDPLPGPTGPSREAGPLFSATTTTINTQTPIALFVFVPCAAGGAGEVISISGDLHSLFHLTISESGNIHIKQHNQPMGISGVGLTTGDKYQGTGVTQQSQSINGPLPQTVTFVNNFRMIGQGPDNNFMIHENAHVTINANGELTSLHDNFSVECK